MQTGKQLYAVSVVALKPDPLLTVFVSPQGETQIFFDCDTDMLSCVNLYPEIRHAAFTLAADSTAEAEESALRMMRERCPEGEGWIIHAAAGCVCDLSGIVESVRRRLLRSLPDEPRAEGGLESYAKEWEEYL